MKPRFPPDPRPGQHRRWRLWVLLCLLVALTLGTLIFLAREYEEVRSMDALEQDAAALAADIRSDLAYNVQTLQTLHAPRVTAPIWEDLAGQILSQHRELVRLEWRDNDLRLLAARDSSFLAQPFEPAQRERVLADARQACTTARRISLPAYAPSYFWPQPQGMGMELMELCLPLTANARPDGFLIATYSLLGMLAEFPDKDAVRGKTVALTEVDGTRLALFGSMAGGRRAAHTSQLLDLPGVTMMVRLESPRDAPSLFPNVLTALVSALALALLAVLLLLARDMRRRMRVESELAQALAFRSAMENSLVTGLRARDMDGRITYVNPAFCEMVGLGADQLLGQSLPAPYWPPDLAEEYRQRQAVRLAGMRLPREGFESVFMRPDGTRFPVRIIEAPLIDDQGQQTGWMGAVLDLSEQRRVEELSRASQERMQATARLAMVGEMASLLSHELNQPLAAMASYASGGLNLIKTAPAGGDTELLGDLRQAMQRILEQAERAGRVIKSVADLVRRREQVREAVPPQLLFDAIMPLLQLHAPRRRIHIDVDIAPGCPAVLCDPTMIEQVLLNLTRNGMQAMPDGDPPSASGLRVLTLSVQPWPGHDGSGTGQRQWLEFAVTDHGAGLPAEVAARLFTPFFTTKSEGMGLGLSLCRTVIEQHGGVLGHRPAHPRGTVFHFTLPVANAPQPRLAPPPPAHATGSAHARAL